MGENSHRYYPLIISICLIIATFAIYWPVYRHDFVRYDDGTYVIYNTNIHSGLNLKSIRWAFTAGYASNWHPLTWISHTVDYQLFKDAPGGHHIVNVLFHILNTILLFYVLWKMTDTIWASAFVAAAFALHPLHVESVAWVAERKDLLSTFFWILTMWAYTCYVRSLKFKWYLLTLLLFILGLMSKPMLVTVPFVLLLLDYWPLERKFSQRLLIEKIPLLICSAASCVITFISQQRGGATRLIESFSLTTRVENSIVSYITYIMKMFWPSRLAVFYPHPGNTLSTIKVVLCALLLLLISIYFIYKMRRHRFLAVGWLWYLGTMVPVIGLVQVGAQAMADRYTYMTLTGLFIIIAFSAKEFIPKWRNKNIVLGSLAVITLTASTAAAARQVRHWKNDLSLFGHAIQVTENNYVMIDNYAITLITQGQYDQAGRYFSKSLSIKPDSPNVHNNLGNLLMRNNRIKEAEEHFRLAIKYKPDFKEAYYNLYTALREQGRFEEAGGCCAQALSIDPNFVKAYLCLAIISNDMKKYEQAIEYSNKALEIEPANIYAYNCLGIALAGLGRTDEAIQAYRTALQINPGNAASSRLLKNALENR
ncbi:MAG: tetratricopeptide repeat protein [Sedimentisphaerales bacterium]|nr:tetratricopeptide repeat protein [Sedimentisphaerales bacterium]